MFIRSIFIPSLIACAIAAPLLLSKAKQSKVDANRQNNQAQNVDPWGNPYTPNQYGGSAATSTQSNVPVNPFRQASTNSSFQNAPNGNPIFHQANSQQAYPPFNPASPAGPITQPSNSLSRLPSAQTQLPATMGIPVGYVQPNLAGMTPDYGAAETIILPGNEFGPDMNAAPLEFMPVTNFEEIFRFDVTPTWVKSRWKRVSTSPDDFGLHGLRVALVTGTNSWDLHGSLTYYFDNTQRAQRITFRGWAGDANKLTNLLTQRFGFRAQPTHWAGFYLAESKRKPTGAILMQHPAVIYTENPVQQIAVVMEMNNPQSRFELSDEFRSLILGSQQSR